MKLIIAGGRNYTGTEEDLVMLHRLMEKYYITEIVSGKATGADEFGEEFAGNAELPIKPFPAKWKDLKAPGAIIKYRNGTPYNAKAGTDRNREMALYADYLCLFAGGKGTSNMRREAKAAGVEIVYDNGWFKSSTIWFHKEV